MSTDYSHKARNPAKKKSQSMDFNNQSALANYQQVILKPQKRGKVMRNSMYMQ